MISEYLIVNLANQAATDFYTEVAAAEVFLDETKAGGFRLHLSLWRQTAGTWLHLDDERLSAFTEVTLSARLANQAEEELLSGYITQVNPHFDVDPNGCTLELVGMDKSVLLDRVEKLQAWPNQKDSDIATQIFNQYGLTPQVTDTQVIHDEAVSTIIQRETDMQFLTRLARRNGLECFVEGDNGYFQAPNLNSTPQPILAAYFAEQTNVDQITLEMNALRPVPGVGLFQVNLFDGKQVLKVESTTAQRHQQPALGKTEPQQLAKADVKPSQLYLSREVTTGQPEMEALCQSLFHQAEWFVTGEGTLNTSRYGHVLKPRQLVTIKGIGETYSGVYYVTAVTHTFTREGYTQTFRVKRNGIYPTGKENFSE